MTNIRLSLWSALMVLTGGLVPAPAYGDIIAVTFSSPPASFTSGGNATRGWEFSTSSPINVTALGLWDQNADGFANVHQVGIWDNSSALLTSVTIPAGTSAFLLGPDDFRFLTLGTPLSLSPGTYRIGAEFVVGDADQIARLAGPIGAPGFVTYLGPRLSPGPGFADPTAVSNATAGAFGPNFLFNQVVPEPSSFALAVLAVSVALAPRGSRAIRRTKRCG